jgi:UDP-3-O-[3-hydroxymyristoyl] glucosamine N-acyltransferase
MKLEQLALKLNCELEGDGHLEITNVATLEDATEGEISFLSNPKYVQEARRTKASAIIVGPDCPALAVSLLRHKNPYLMFAKAIELFYQEKLQRPAVHPTAWVADTATVGKDVSIGAYSVVGENVLISDRVRIKEHCVIQAGVSIGEATVLHSGAVLRQGVRVGSRCIIQDNVVVGSDGFGYAKQEDGSWYKILQAGTVVIEDDVEIGANSTVDRAALGETRIHRGAKIDNLVQIGHGCVVGENSLVCAQVGLAGSTKVGKNVILAGQVGSAGHLTIGDGAVLTAQSGIHDSIEPGKIISGSPGFDNKKWLRATAIYARLPEIYKVIRELESKVASLENIYNVLHEEQESLSR